MDIQSLPDLALLKVLSFFSHEEKIRTLMLVSKRFNTLLQNGIQQMCIYESRTPFKPSWGFFSGGEIADDFVVRTKELDEPAYLKFRNLKQLFLFKVANPARFFNATNEGSLGQLVELKICGLPWLPKYEIKLPNLKRLWLRSLPGQPSLITPNLESLAVLDNYLQAYELSAPEKLKFLKCRDFTESFANLNLVNLEHLICRSLASFLSLEKMPKLKRVELWPGIVSRTYEISQSKAIWNLQNLKRTLNRRDLEIWHCGLKENHHKLSPDLFADFQRFFMFNHNLEGKPRNDRALDVFDYFDYNDPVSVFPGQISVSSSFFSRKFPNFEGIPRNFFKVFISIKAVHVDCEVNGANVIRFLKEAKRVRDFSVENARFDLEFFEELCQIQSIHHLSLRNAFPLEIHHLDVSFVLNLNNIKILRVRKFGYAQSHQNLQISIKQFEKFLRTVNGSLSHFHLSSGRNFVYLINFCPDTFTLRHNNFDRDELDFDRNIDEMIQVQFSGIEELVSYLERMPKEHTLFI